MEIDGYEIIEQISQGPISTVYLGVQRSLQRRVLIKQLNPQWLNEADLLERFRREALICARLKHRNIVDIIDVETRPEKLYLVIEYIEGLNLAHFIQQHHPVPFPVMAYISREILCGLAYAHEQGVIHRDIKPSNIMIGRDGSVKIADFGLAKMADFPNISTHGEVVGTPAYMSPEQVRVSLLDARSDLFSLGITFYELAGQPSPFQGKSIVDSIQKVLHHHPPPLHELRPDIPQWYSDLVRELLAKKISERPAAAAAILERPEFEQVSARPTTLIKMMQNAAPAGSRSAPPEAVPISSANAASRTSRRRFTVPAMLLLLALITAVSLGAFLKGNSSGNSQPPLAAPSPAESTRSESEQPFTEAEQDFPEKTSVATPRLAKESENRPERTVHSPDTAARRPATSALQNVSTADVAVTNKRDELPASGSASGKGASIAYLFVECFPWAEVYINGEKRDTTPLQSPLALPAGRHLLELRNPRRPELAPHRREILLHPGQTDTIMVNLQPQGAGYLQLHVTPWAEVYINGQYRENTPLPTPLRLPPGRYDLKLIHPNYPVWRDSIEIQPGQTVVKRVALAR